MSLSKRIAANTIAQIVGKIGTTTLGVIITILLTRYLGPAGFGAFTFILVFVAMFGTVADWGMTIITIREASKNDAKASEIIGNVLVIRLFLATIAAVVAAVAIQFLPYDQPTRTLVAVASLSLIAMSLKTSFQIIFNVRLRLENTALSDFLANLTTLLVILLVIYLGLGLTGVVVAYLCGDLLAAMVAAYLSFKILPLKFSLVKSTTKYVLLESLPMGAILVTFTIYNRIDTVILSYFRGQEAVGHYGAAYRVYEVLTLGAAYFANSVLPLISNLAHTNKVKLVEVYRKSFVVLLLMGCTVALTNFFLAPLGIAIIAGPEFTPSVEALQILSLALVVAYFNHLNGYTLIALGKQWYSFAIAIVALAVNVVLNWVYIPIYSFKAAAFITFITEAIIVVATIILLRRFINLTPRLADVVSVSREFIQKRGRIFDYA